MKEFIQKHKLFSFYTALMLVIVFIAIFAPWLAPGDAFTSDMSKALQAPSAQHWFGTDKLGRDVLSRIIYGTQLSLFMGVSIVVIMVSIGTISTTRVKKLLIRIRRSMVRHTFSTKMVRCCMVGRIGKELFTTSVKRWMAQEQRISGCGLRNPVC